MIRLTRFGGEPFLLNAELIQYVEARPDTYITLANGERLIVAEAMDEVLRRVMVYQQAKHLCCAAVHAAGRLSSCNGGARELLRLE